jgi:hypothetical protein
MRIMKSSSDADPIRLAAERAARSAMPALAEVIMRLLAELRDSVAVSPSPPLVAVPFPARVTRALVRRGELAARKMNRTWYAKPADIERLIPAARPELGEPANDGAEVAPEEGADRVLRDILEPKGLRLRASGPTSSKGPSEPRRRAVQGSASRRRA